jgi:hypothetical protein
MPNGNWKAMDSAPKDGRKVLLIARLSISTEQPGPVVGYWLKTVQGWRPRHIMPSTRSPLFGCSQTTGRSWPGAALKWGGKFAGQTLFRARERRSEAVALFCHSPCRVRH